MTTTLSSRPATLSAMTFDVVIRLRATLANKRISSPNGLAASAAQDVIWILPPWKPCEAGKGPGDFAGVPLDRAAGERAEKVRSLLADFLKKQPHIRTVADLGPHDHRLYPDGLHPHALGFSAMAASFIQQS